MTQFFLSVHWEKKLSHFNPKSWVTWVELRQKLLNWKNIYCIGYPKGNGQSSIIAKAVNTFTLANGYSRHVEFAQNAQPQFSSLYWNELSNILWMCMYVFIKYICTIKSIDAYRRHAAFGPFEVWIIAHDVYCRHEEMKHEVIPI